VGYNGRKMSCVVGSIGKKLFAILRFFSVVTVDCGLGSRDFFGVGVKRQRGGWR
jgi:hypothetical protein